jgi:hypothetical protein
MIYWIRTSIDAWAHAEVLRPICRLTHDFLSQLREHVAAREIERGIACLRSHQDLIAKLDPSQENAARLLAQLAIWTDIGFSGPPLRELLQRFEHLNRDCARSSRLPTTSACAWPRA